jgi:hypothetical protein
MECTATANGFKLALDITNTSKVDGDEVVQLYYNVVNSVVNRPIKRMFDFKRVHVKSGETVHLEKEYYMLDPKDSTYFEYCDITRRIMVVEDADYNIMVGTSSSSIKSTFTVHISGEKVSHRNVTRQTLAKDYNSAYGIEVSYCAELEKPYVYCNSWSGSLTFRNCLLVDIDSIHVIATSVLGNGKIVVKTNGKELCTIVVPASDGFYDFKDFKSTFNQRLDCIQDLEVVLEQGMGMLSMRLYDSRKE